MTDAIQQSSVTTASAPQRRPQAAGDDAPPFSYAMASASLERQAAQSLETHGAAPKGSSPASAASAPSSGQPQSGRSSAAGSSAQPSAHTGAQAGEQSPAEAAPSAAAPSQSRSISAPPLAPQTPSPAPPALQAAGVAANGAKIVQAAAPVREQMPAARLTAAKAQAANKAQTAPTPTPLQEDFARILARRLDKASQFEFRLDPPEMGRVEGRLTLGDDGKATLALKFENQSAFDMFARDEQALRQSLANAGFEFAQGDFVFSFHDDGPDQQIAGAEMQMTAIAAAPVYEAAFSAPWTAGALDIRV